MTRVLFTSSIISDGNMSFRRGDPDEALQNRLKFFEKHQLNYENYVGMAPTHTSGIKIVSLFDKGKMLDETDAIITNDPSLILFTLTGDCIPLALTDSEKNVFSLIHISRLNAASGILTETISTFIYNFHSSPQKLIAEFGPSIGPCCYYHTNPLQLEDKKWQPFIKPIEGTYALDLWGFVEAELKTIGLKKENIKNPGVCSFHSNKYFSHYKATKGKLDNDYRFGTLLTVSS